MSVLTVEGLGKRYDRRWIFREINFTLGKGDRLIIRGHNGSGKSTLLRVVAGLLSPSEGKIHLPEDPRNTVGYSALEGALYPAITVAEHLEFTAKLRGCEARTDELLALIGLEYARDYAAMSLSTGMKSRLKLAIAVQARPLVLLLDEPGAALDEAGKGLVDTIMAEQQERGCALIASNDLDERRLANLELVLGS